MTSTAGADGTAFNASVSTTQPDRHREYLRTYADDCERAVATIQAKLDGIKTSLADAKTEAKRARAEADDAEGQ